EHRVVRVDGADPLEQGLADEVVVRRGVVMGDAALVAPVHVDLPPVDLRAGVVGQALVAGPGRLTAGDGEREAVVRAAVERLDDPFGELSRDVVDDDELSVQGAAYPSTPSSAALAPSASSSSSKDFENAATP